MTEQIRKRRRRPRKDKQRFAEIIQPWKEEAKRRAEARPVAAGIIVETDKDGCDYLDCPHDDPEAWWLMLADAFGTRSDGVIRTFMGELRRLASGSGRHIDQERLNFALNLMNGIRPKTEMEAALAAQMVAVHLLTMKSAQIALQPGDYCLPERNALLTAKLARAFADQVSALQKLQGNGRTQNITVVRREEKHAHIHHHYGDGGGPKDGSQAHDATAMPVSEIETAAEPDGVPALEPPSGAEVWGPDPSGNIVPLPVREGAAEVPEARRGAWKWSAKGEQKRELEERGLHQRGHRP